MLDRSKSTIIVKFECVPNTYTCHERHIHGRIYGQIRDPLRRKEIASDEPRITQIKSLKAKPFNPHSTKRDYHPSHSQAKRIRSNQERCDLFEKVREIQSKNIQEHLADSNVSMMRKGNIHELQSTATYFTVSLWSKETITLYTNLAKFDDPGIFIDSTELLVAPIDGRNTITYKARIPSPTTKGFITVWECHSNRKNQQIFNGSITAFDEHVKEYNNGDTFSPGCVTFDDWPPFCKTLCLRWNLKPFSQYLDDEHRRLMGMQNIPKNRCTLVLGLVHIKKSIKQYYNYSKAQEISKFSTKQRKRIKYLSYDVINFIASSFNVILIIQAIQIFNVLTKLTKFNLKQPVDVSDLFWKHDILCPLPQFQFERNSKIQFEFEASGNYYHSQPFPYFEIFVMERRSVFTMNLIYLNQLKQYIQISVDKDYSFDNPYFMPCAANYMNVNKFRRIALFTRLCIGERDRTTNQTIEGTFNVDKNHPIDGKKKLRLDKYIQTTLKYQKYEHQQYFQECSEFRNLKIKQELDQTRKSNIALSEREKSIHEKFDKFIRIRLNGNYQRSVVKQHFDSFYKQEKYPPTISLQKISDLKTGKNISHQNDWIGFVETWLDSTLNGA